MIGVAVVIAGALDATVGEPADRWHPVAWLGRAIEALDRDWPRPRLAGIGVAGVIVGLAAGVAAGVTRLGSAIAPPIGVAVAGLVLWVSISRRDLFAVARDRLSASDDAALDALVGRPTADLDAAHRRSAIVESVAENVADGLVGPLAGFLVGAVHSPAAAAAGTAAMTAVDALDATIGYPDRPLGWASARADDWLAVVPARLTAGAIAIAAADPGAIGRASATARRPASPNSGWPMATLAAVVGIALEKPGAYRVGTGPLPDTVAVGRALAVLNRAAWLSIVAAVLLGALVGVAGHEVSAAIATGVLG
ncbi:MAG: CobD/CbiB family cobalamin biosynthesis protein [Halococcoides sp.]